MKKVSMKLKKDINKTAIAEVKAGAKVEINHSLPYVSIKRADEEEYFFQESEASELLEEVPDNISAQNYLLWVSKGW